MPTYNEMPARNNAAPPLDPRWQQQLTALLGLNPSGQPKLRLVWGQAAKQFYWEGERLKYQRAAHRYLAGYEEWGLGEGDEELSLIANHPPTVEPPAIAEGHVIRRVERIERIGVDRWFIELWAGPKTMGRNPVWWELEHRWQVAEDPATGICRRFDVYGPYPRQGDYRLSPFAYPWMISRHALNQSCCKEREAEALTCFGQYRAPEQRDIDYIAWQVQEVMSQPDYGYDELAPQRVVDQDTRDDIKVAVYAEQKAEAETEYRIKNYMSTHGKRWVTDGGKLRRAKYTDFGKAIAILKENQSQENSCQPVSTTS